MKNQHSTISSTQKSNFKAIFGVTTSTLVFIFALLFSGFTTKEGDKNKDVSKDVKKETNTLLYKISGNGLEKDSYLFGTIHVICSEDYFVPKGYEEALKEVQQIALEVDMDDPNLMTDMQKVSIMPTGMHLKQLLSEEEYNVVAKFFKDSLGIPENQFEMMGVIKPMLLSSMTIQKSISCSATKMYETEIVAKATEMKKEVLGVETIEAQFEALDKTPFKEQAKLLYEGIVKFEEGKETLSKLIEAYKSQSVANTYAMIKEGSKDYGDFEKELVTARNQNWIPVMQKMAGEKSTFFAVGAGHLGGEKGVIQLLKDAGYTLTPVQ